MLDQKVKEIRFKCTGCGICCGTPPALNLGEIVAQSKNFILGAQLRIISHIDVEDPDDVITMEKSYPALSVSEDPDLRQRLGAHMSKIAEKQGVPVTSPLTMGSSPRIAFSLIDVDQLSFACPQRGTDGGCMIYETRPAKCRVVPLDETVPEEDAGEEMQYAIETMLFHEGKCETGPTADVLWKDGRIVDETSRELHLSSGIEMNDDVASISIEVIEEYLDFKAHESGLSRTKVENVVEHLGSEGKRPIFALVPALGRCLKIGALSQKTCVEILRSQIKLIDERLPHIHPDEEIEGVMDANMLTVLTDWRSMYAMIADAWERASRERT